MALPSFGPAATRGDGIPDPSGTRRYRVKQRYGTDRYEGVDESAQVIAADSIEDAVRIFNRPTKSDRSGTYYSRSQLEIVEL